MSRSNPPRFSPAGGRVIRPINEAKSPLVRLEMLEGYSHADFIRVLDRGVVFYGDDRDILVDAPLFELLQRRIEEGLNEAVI